VPIYANTSTPATPTTGSTAATITPPPLPFNFLSDCNLATSAVQELSLAVASVIPAFVSLLRPGISYDQVAALYNQVEDFLNKFCPNSTGIDGLLLYSNSPECLAQYQSASKLFRATKPTDIFVFSVSTGTLALCYFGGSTG
jgi:hypothetical protein